MARVISPICRKCRREGSKLFLKGERCFSAKCAFVRRSYAPGMHGASSRSRNSQYAQQLREKQKTKIIYGILEKQFVRYYEQMKRKNGLESMLSLIEKRMDNVVFRMGFASSRRASRQMVLHGKFTLNGKRMSIPSAQVKVGDIIAVKSISKDKDMEKTIRENMKRQVPVSWLKVNSEGLTAEVTSLPRKEDIGEDINEKLIIEYYSR